MVLVGRLRVRYHWALYLKMMMKLGKARYRFGADKYEGRVGRPFS